VTVTGMLKSFDGRTYGIQTDAAGEMRLSAATFSCQSEACPKQPLVFGIHGSNTIGAQLMPAIVEGYAQFVGDRTRIQAGRVPDPGQEWRRASRDRPAFARLGHLAAQLEV